MEVNLLKEMSYLIVVLVVALFVVLVEELFVVLGLQEDRLEQEYE